MYWINVKGKFATDNPDLFVHNLKHLMEQTKTSFSGNISQQRIIDIQCTDYEKTEEVIEEIKSKENETV
jgi:hypothetical protein